MATKGKATIITGDTPLKHFSGCVWGVNIVRSMKDLKGAPSSIRKTYKTIMKVGAPPGTQLCCSCGELADAIGGVAVLRILDHMPIVLVLCEECVKESADTRLHARIMKTMVGDDVRTIDWKDLQRRTLQ